MLGAGLAPSLRSPQASLPGPLQKAQSALPASSSPPDPPFYAIRFESIPSAAALTALGRRLFFDESLSASGKLACASCHVPSHAFGPPGDSPVQRGGIDGRRTGVRAVPSLMYSQNVPAFTEHYSEDEGDDSVDQGPVGGRTWDGRAQSAHDQARLPLLSPFEMANVSETAVVAKIKAGAAAQEFRDTFGAHVFENYAFVFEGALLALETFQQSPSEFYPYSSRYDGWLRHRASLTAAELRGLDAFNDPDKGNCARCHPSSMREGALPQFSDFGYAAIGAPRNPAIAANKSNHYHDLGLCGPLRTDLAEKKEYCGMFRTPSLRNVALRRVFFHNGAMHRLRDVVSFYAYRDTNPDDWYPRGADGRTRKFDDLPEIYWPNVDRDAPFVRHPGDSPRLSEADITDIAAFLETLTDSEFVSPR